ncbi:MAG: type II toxin-antitoxin system Phd/YefM family antitoxin [Candidatus Anammoxibacter sp.]
MKTIAISEFKAKCLDLIAKMDKTKNPIIITKNGHSIAKLIPFKGQNNLDDLRGSVKYYGDIISPIDESWEVDK